VLCGDRRGRRDDHDHWHLVNVDRRDVDQDRDATTRTSTTTRMSRTSITPTVPTTTSGGRSSGRARLDEGDCGHGLAPVDANRVSAIRDRWGMMHDLGVRAIIAVMTGFG
jgi:hypothetical protein